ncbi:MAG TPA: hypothetical protein VMY37_03975 [Thermoguttaceae bacterium]|nr:hypothetical protein [Thermoguttaceae bacterium]
MLDHRLVHEHGSVFLRPRVQDDPVALVFGSHAPKQNRLSSAPIVIDDFPGRFLLPASLAGGLDTHDPIPPIRNLPGEDVLARPRQTVLHSDAETDVRFNEGHDGASLIHAAAHELPGSLPPEVVAGNSAHHGDSASRCLAYRRVNLGGLVEGRLLSGFREPRQEAEHEAVAMRIGILAGQAKLPTEGWNRFLPLLPVDRVFRDAHLHVEKTRGEADQRGAFEQRSLFLRDHTRHGTPDERNIQPFLFQPFLDPLE